MTIRSALIDIVAVLVLFLLAGVLVALWTDALPIVFRLPVIIVFQGVLLIGVVAVVLALRGQPWRQIWFLRPRIGDVGRGALAFGACLVLNMVFVYSLYGSAPDLVDSHAEQLSAIAYRLSEHLWLPGLVAMLAFVGVYEEIFARGLLLSRCRALLGGFWLPVFASSVLFGLGHMYQGWIGVGQTTLVGVVLAVATLRWGTLWPAIIAHAFLDISSVLFMSGLIEHGAGG